jgi:hypothetical protein
MVHLTKFSSAKIMESDNRITSEYWIADDVEGNDYNLF